MKSRGVVGECLEEEVALLLKIVICESMTMNVLLGLHVTGLGT